MGVSCAFTLPTRSVVSSSSAVARNLCGLRFCVCATAIPTKAVINSARLA